MWYLVRGIVSLGLVALLAGMAGAAAPASRAAAPTSKAEEIRRLGWEFEARRYKLPRSESTLSLKAGLAMVRGAHARRMVYLSQGRDFPEVEAVLVDPQTASGIIIAYLESGYIRMDDWARINATRLLDRIREVTAAANREKSGAGLSTVTIRGWMRPPTLDRKSQSVSWAIEAVDGATPIVNAVTLKLGKRGFEKLTWIGRRELYFEKKTMLDEVRNSLEFAPGARYQDFAQGDHQASFGIATLVSAAAGAGAGPEMDRYGTSAWIVIAAGVGLMLATALLAIRGWRRRRTS